MALVAAAVCPHPPLLIPEVGRGVDDPVRTHARDAVRRLLDARPDLVVVVGDGPWSQAYSSADSGSLAGFGVDLTVPLGPRACGGEAVLPLSLTVGAWLLRATGWTGDRQGYAISGNATAEEAASRGVEIADLDERVALLCMGDGSARRSEKAPGWFDERAEAFDASVVSALEQADAEALLALHPSLARELLVAGRASWQVLAGAAGGVRWQASVTYADAPFGVGYVVAEWRPADSAAPGPSIS
jgi:hypothetical protein